MGSQKRGAGRPAKPVLNRDLIAEQALELVVEEGLDRLTMTRLAKKLGVATSALYNHVDNKADIVLLIQDALVSQVSVEEMLRLTQGEATLDSALAAWARSYRAVFAKYPSLIPLIAVTPVSDAPMTLRMYNIVAEAVVSAGIPQDKVISVIVAFESFLFGSALDMNAPSNVLDAGESSAGSSSLERAVAATKSSAQEAGVASGSADQQVQHTNFYAEPPFQLGLGALIRQALELVQ